MKKAKSYSVHIQFNAHRLTVKASSQAEAKKKAIEKLSKKRLASLIDKSNCYAETI